MRTRETVASGMTLVSATYRPGMHVLAAMPVLAHAPQRARSGWAKSEPGRLGPAGQGTRRAPRSVTRYVVPYGPCQV